MRADLLQLTDSILLYRSLPWPAIVSLVPGGCQMIVVVTWQCKVLDEIKVAPYTPTRDPQPNPGGVINGCPGRRWKGDPAPFDCSHRNRRVGRRLPCLPPQQPATGTDDLRLCRFDRCRIRRPSSDCFGDEQRAHAHAGRGEVVLRILSRLPPRPLYRRCR